MRFMCNFTGWPRSFTGFMRNMTGYLYNITECMRNITGILRNISPQGVGGFCFCFLFFVICWEFVFINFPALHKYVSGVDILQNYLII